MCIIISIPFSIVLSTSLSLSLCAFDSSGLVLLTLLLSISLSSLSLFDFLSFLVLFSAFDSGSTQLIPFQGPVEKELLTRRKKVLSKLLVILVITSRNFATFFKCSSIRKCSTLYFSLSTSVQSSCKDRKMGTSVKIHITGPPFS